MNSRSVSDNLVNFSTELATTLNQLDSKEPLLSFPFDHLYACHSESASDHRQSLHLGREIEITTHCGLPHQDKHETQRIVSLESQNKKLKDLLIYHLDLIQQQNDLMSKREKVYQALKQENDTLKLKVTQAVVEQKVPVGQQSQHPPPLVPVTATITSIKSELPSETSQPTFFNFTELLTSDEHNPVLNPYLYSSDLSTPKSLDSFDLRSDTGADLQSFLVSELGSSNFMPSILEGTTVPADTYTMIDNKMPTVTDTKRAPSGSKRPKKEHKTNENKPVVKIKDETLSHYTVTTHSGSAKIQRNRKRTTGIGSFSRMPKTKAATKPEKSTIYDNDIYNMNKQSKMNTYSKSKNDSIGLSRFGYTALEARLQLIEPTPTGEDPYQIGEAEMREQSPIPKLILQKPSQDRMKQGGVTSTITSVTGKRRVYDTMSSTTSGPSRNKRGKYSTDLYSESNMHVQSKRDSALDEDIELDVEKTDNEIDWRVFTINKPKETSLCDFSYGETSANLVNVPLDITRMEFPDLFEPGPVNADSVEIETTTEKKALEKTKKRACRTNSLAGPLKEKTISERKRGTDSKRGRKRALSTAASVKRGDSTQQKAPAKPRARRALRGKTTPVPGMMTKKLYHTCMGDPDVSWYLGLDPNIKKEDCEPANDTTSNVEVPRWREKPYASLYSLEGTENLDDKVFEKRHLKLEAEERRQLRWHMRRVREQRHVEKLRQRQRDPWAPNTAQPPSRDYTVWPQPIRDLQTIEITDTFPVNAFGVELPDLPDKNFVLPWVRSSKALKKSKRSKTLH